jgi:hypothetical protein
MRCALPLALGVAVWVAPCGWAADLYVSRDGTDLGNDCRTPTSPCRTISFATSQAATGDAIKVASGNYRDLITVGENTTLTFSGGWSADFGARAPALNPTVIKPGVNEFGSQLASQIHIGGSYQVAAQDVIDVTIDGFTFTGATAGPGRIHGADTDAIAVRFVDTQFVRNRGDRSDVDSLTIEAVDDSTVVVSFSRCRFERNAQHFGGGLRIKGSGSGDSVIDVALSNCVIAQNGTPRNSGGAIMVSAFGAGAITTRLTNSTITRNRSRFGGGIFVEAGNGVTTFNLTNTIVWGNRARGIGRPGYEEGGRDVFAHAAPASPGVLTINATHSDLDDLVLKVGTLNDLGGNVNADPLFVRRADHHLSGVSPLIDAGTCSGAPATDDEGDARPSGAGCDIGADEFAP